APVELLEPVAFESLSQRLRRLHRMRRLQESSGVPSVGSIRPLGHRYEKPAKRAWPTRRQARSALQQARLLLTSPMSLHSCSSSLDHRGAQSLRRDLPLPTASKTVLKDRDTGAGSFAVVPHFIHFHESRPAGCVVTTWS